MMMLTNIIVKVVRVTMTEMVMVMIMMIMIITVMIMMTMMMIMIMIIMTMIIMIMIIGVTVHMIGLIVNKIFPFFVDIDFRFLINQEATDCKYVFTGKLLSPSCEAVSCFKGLLPTL